jgi:hypothetical protein
MTNRRRLDLACAGALGALALMTWQIVDPRVWPVMVAMSLGQVLGTASLAAFGYTVFVDFQDRRRGERASFGKVPDGPLQDSKERPPDPPAAADATAHP